MVKIYFCFCIHILYRLADKSLVQPTSQCILFDGENISFDAFLVIYMYIQGVPGGMCQTSGECSFYTDITQTPISKVERLRR